MKREEKLIYQHPALIVRELPQRTVLCQSEAESGNEGYECGEGYGESDWV